MRENTGQPEQLGGFNPPQKRSAREIVSDFFKGIVIGIGAILPGLSGGVLSVIFKVYEPIMRFLARPFYRFWDNVRYFLPLGFGGVLGIFIFAFFVSAALGSYEALFTCLFIGLVAGTFPSLWREAGEEGRERQDYYWMFGSALVLFVLMLLGGESLVQVQESIPVWFLVGAVIGLGVIVPGLSPSNFLMYFGLYKPMSDAIKTMQWSAVIPLAFGGIASVFGLAKPVNYLLDKHYSRIYHFILGLVIGSSLAIFPTVVAPGLAEEKLASMSLSLIAAILLCLLFFFLGLGLSLLFNRLDSVKRNIALD